MIDIKKLLSTNIILVFLTLTPGIFLISFLVRILYPLHYDPKPIFIADLIGSPIFLPYVLTILLYFANFFLVYLISTVFFKKSFVFIPPLIYSLSPIFSYLSFAGSFYIYLTFWFLLLFYSLLKYENGKLFSVLVVISILTIVNSYALGFFILGLFLIAGYLLKLIDSKKTKLLFTSLMIGFIPFAILSVINIPAAKNIYHGEVSFLSDPGIIQTVNVFQGETKKNNFKAHSRLVENKYIYTIKYLFLKAVKNIMPNTFFTPQEKLLGFSFSAPFYLGFLIPFIYGIYCCHKKIKLFLLISIILILPSFINKPLVNLNRLVIFTPVVLFTISYGFYKLIAIKTKKVKVLLLIIVSLILLQSITTYSDIIFREYPRFVRIFGSNIMELGKQ